MDQKLGKESVNRYLDTAILHEIVFKEILGINQEARGRKQNTLITFEELRTYSLWPRRKIIISWFLLCVPPP